MKKVKKGDLYKTVEIEGVTFDIYYGYDSETDELRGWEPTPIYPDFEARPQYTKDGTLFTLAYREPCEHYDKSDGESDDAWCADCTQFDQREEFIGLCKCPMNKIRKTNR